MPDQRIAPTSADPVPPPSCGSTPARRRYISEQLFGEHTEVEIQHGESTYRLRLTSLGKLILTK